MQLHDTPEAPLGQAFLRVKRSVSSDTWELLIAAMNQYTYGLTVAVTNAQPSDVIVWQGRARQCFKLIEMLNECERFEPPQQPGV